MLTLVLPESMWSGQPIADLLVHTLALPESMRPGQPVADLLVPKRTHRKKRIRKKWLKKYGHHKLPENEFDRILQSALIFGTGWGKGAYEGGEIAHVDIITVRNEDGAEQ